ncbi:MAG: disulfide bond formation protein B [Magnetococcales bacterium]|nr:disulfide bond formation protein B [Magnetococcales bacterium]
MNDSTPKQSTVGWNLLFAAWVVATGATLASLFLSEVVGIPVCTLCWYQRIALYPQVVILGLALFPYDPKALRPAAVLTGVGGAIALFQLLLVAGIIPESAQPCAQGIPCGKTFFSLFGFLNIPMMSLLTFTLIGFLLYFVWRK